MLLMFPASSIAVLVASLHFLCDNQEIKVAQVLTKTTMMSAASRKRRSPRSLRPCTMQEFFPSNNKQRRANTTAGKAHHDSGHQKVTSGVDAGLTKNIRRITNDQAERWAKYLDNKAPPTYLTEDGKSWYIFAKKWMPAPSSEAFEQEWNLHPANRHSLKLFGRTVLEKRWSQSWGVAYAYSGATNQARALEEGTMVSQLLERVNEIAKKVNADQHSNNDNSIKDSKEPYNGCLQNWYTPEDTIGLHADDEKSMRKEYPIFSLSWGGPRRFLLRRKQKKKDDQDVQELWLEDGDLLVMGGTCQDTHKHEVPKVRAKDPATSNRINWTIRAFRAST